MSWLLKIRKAISSIEKKPLVIGYIAVIFSLFLYSFTQVDLSLTLSRASIWQDIQKSFQYIGYFDRFTSAILYSLIIFLMFTFYLTFLSFINKKKLSKKTVWTTIAIVTAILTFSYNAFSYDLFNYIFDAKIVTHYMQNPYEHKALDYPGDPMLSFMHWTHRTYPYGPIWLVLTVPLSFLGFQFFLPTQILFKLLMAVSFLGSAFFIGRIVKKIRPNDELFSVAFFALNPLILIESLVSAHHDIVMICLSLWSLYMLISQKYVRAFFLFLASAGIKFVTGFLLPIYILLIISMEKNKKINWDYVVLGIIFLMTLGVIAAAIRTVFQPWYLLFVLPYAALIAKRYFVFIPAVFISGFAVLQYIPFLYTGNWDAPIPSILFYLVVSSVIISIVGIFIWYLKMART